MADLFGIKRGLRIFGDEATAEVLNGTSDPSSAAGVAAELGSLYLKADGVSFKKTGVADTDWQAYSEIEGGGLLWSTISGATTAESSRGYILDSAAAVFTVTLPAAPEEGDSVGFAGLGDIDTNNITVDLNGLNMNGSGDDLVIDLDYCYFEMLYTGDATTGWVLSNTDESGNIDNVQAFIGNGDNVDSAVTEYTEENYITSGTNLEDSIDTLDIALASTLSGTEAAADILAARVTTNEGDISSNSTDIGNNDTDISDLELYTGSAGTSSPDYSTENYVADTDSLVVAIGKLDAALQAVDNISATGVNWRASVTAATGDVITTGVGDYAGTDHFSDDDVPFWTHDMWTDGDRVVSLNATTSGIIYEWADGADQFNQVDALGANDAVSVQYDFPDAPGSQEDGASYMMNSDMTEIIKIADFDLETAATIAISDGYTAGVGTITSADSVESAIQKLDGNSDANDTAITNLDNRVTTNEGGIITNASGIAGNDFDISALDARVTTNEGDIITNASGIVTNAANISSNNTAIGNNYTYITNVDTAHDNLAAAVLHETSEVVADAVTDEVLDTMAQAGNLGAKWFVVAYTATKRYACEIYALHDGTTNSDITEYAILNIGSPKLKVDFDIVADGTDMSLTADNDSGESVTIKTQRIAIQTAAIDTSAVLS